jgi:hypothetical protein
MERSLLVFWLIAYGALWVLKIRPGSSITRAAFTWIGPRPLSGQTWSSFQARWAIYSFGWLCQIAVVFSALWALTSRIAGAQERPWYIAFAFALTLGAGIALFATLGFVLKAGKARYFGPNPVCNPPPPGKNVAA